MVVRPSATAVRPSFAPTLHVTVAVASLRFKPIVHKTMATTRAKLSRDERPDFEKPLPRQLWQEAREKLGVGRDAAFDPLVIKESPVNTFLLVGHQLEYLICLRLAWVPLIRGGFQCALVLLGLMHA